MSRLRPTPHQRNRKQRFPPVFAGTNKPKGRAGQRCRLLRGAAVPECVWVAFPDGSVFIVARRALRRAEP